MSALEMPGLRIAALEAEVRRLREALHPFVAATLGNANLLEPIGLRPTVPAEWFMFVREETLGRAREALRGNA